MMQPNTPEFWKKIKMIYSFKQSWRRKVGFKSLKQTTLDFIDIHLLFWKILQTYSWLFSM